MSVVGEQEKVNISPSESVSREPLLLGRIRAHFLSDPHSAYTAEDLLRDLKLQSPKDPEKQAAVLAEVRLYLAQLLKEGLIREVAPLLYKTRLFFDQEKNIEHAFIGGMGNASYAFSAPVFRINIGVLSLLFLFNEKKKSWRVSVLDTTIGRNYSLVRPLTEGVHLIGTDPKKEENKTAWAVEGKYIEKTHVTVVLAIDRIEVSDHRTLRGTRVDHFTVPGLTSYLQVGEEFLKTTDPSHHRDIVKRGRFALEKLLQHHKNYEATFFNAVVDFLLIRNSD